jgi:hypothetical protein
MGVFFRFPGQKPVILSPHWYAFCNLYGCKAKEALQETVPGDAKTTFKE